MPSDPPPCRRCAGVSVVLKTNVFSFKNRIQVNDDQLCFFWLVGMLVAILSWLEVLTLVLTEGGIVGQDRPRSARPPRAPLPFRTANRLVRRPNSFNHDTVQTLRIASRAFDRITTTHATLPQLVALLPQPYMSTVAASSRLRTLGIGPCCSELA